MLVCNVSLRAPRSGITAEIAETVTAVDATATGNVVFATLVDDPASVAELVDAYLGEIMLEAASAADSLTTGMAYSSSLDEAVTAADTQDATASVASSTWDAATVTAVTLSGGDLVATNTGTTSTNQGAHVGSTAGKTTGKYYFELTFTAMVGGGGTSFGMGLGTTASTYSGMAGSGTTGNIMYKSGNIWANGGNSGSTLGARAAADVIGLAVDLDNRKIWFREVSGVATDYWNGNVSANPATNVGGVTIPAGTMVPFVVFGGTAGVAGNSVTANFGASAFTAGAPSGFSSGWPA